MPKVDTGKKTKSKESNPNSVDKSPNSARSMKLFMGNTVVLQHKDGSSYTGLCAEMIDKVKLLDCYELPAPQFHEYLIAKETVESEKSFEWDDVVNLKVAAKGTQRRFMTDGEYRSETKVEQPEEITEWVDEGIETPFETDTSPSTGWSVGDMFKKNESLGVRSTFASDLSQYTTCSPVGSAEDRARADEIARSIENNARSSRYNKLENDDEERDLDKETVFDDDQNKRNNRKSNKGPQHENTRAQGLRTANVAANRKEFTRQRDRLNNAKQAGSDYGSPRRSQGDDRNSPNNTTTTSKKRTEELRSWGNEFNNAYQVPPPAISPTTPVTVEEEEKPATPPPVSKSASPAVAETPPKVEIPSAEKAFHFNPNAAAFVPKPKASPQPLVQHQIPPPPMSNYVLAPMPPNSNMIHNLMPQVPIVYSTQMNQQMQGAPPLFAQPNIFMQNDMSMPQNYMQPQHVILQVPAQQPMQQQQIPRNGIRKMVPNGHPMQPPQQRMLPPPPNGGQAMQQPPFQNATYLPQPMYMTSVSMNSAGVPMQQAVQMPRQSGPQQYVYYFTRPEYHGGDPTSYSQPPTPGPANQGASPPGYQLMMQPQQKPHFIPNQVRLPAPLMSMPNQQRKPGARRRNDN